MYVCRRQYTLAPPDFGSSRTDNREASIPDHGIKSLKGSVYWRAPEVGACLPVCLTACLALERCACVCVFAPACMCACVHVCLPAGLPVCLPACNATGSACTLCEPDCYELQRARRFSHTRCWESSLPLYARCWEGCLPLRAQGSLVPSRCGACTVSNHTSARQI